MRYIEILKETVEIVDGSEFYKLLSQPENDDVFDRLKYLIYPEVDKEIHFVIRDKQKIVAVAGLQKNPYNEQEYWIKHYSVDMDYQNRGLATKLIDAVFIFADKHHIALKRSTPTEMGLKYLTEPIKRAMKKYPNVKIH
ncbi:hypothetical protein LCGC14_1449270 [marine sediment metagenome]|uniref:N-acetyltransferase domain-containing protein n=1 Tax=marine sediment metagenome TaxID=412755 RepID=A0A0F9LYU7_9ZZZZ